MDIKFYLLRVSVFSLQPLYITSSGFVLGSKASKKNRSSVKYFPLTMKNSLMYWIKKVVMMMTNGLKHPKNIKNVRLQHSAGIKCHAYYQELGM